MTVDIPLKVGATLIFLVDGADNLILLLGAAGNDFRLSLD
jgi:hypothetical protein